MSSIPPDLRVVNTPLSQRLSPTSAGVPGDDSADILLIHDEWLRTKARSLVRLGRQTISLRLGTFNVNGKLPSQDLSSWIQGRSMLDVSLPALLHSKSTLPISLEDLTRLPDTGEKSLFFFACNQLPDANYRFLTKKRSQILRRPQLLNLPTLCLNRICSSLDFKSLIFLQKPLYIQRVLQGKMRGVWPFLPPLEKRPSITRRLSLIF